MMNIFPNMEEKQKQQLIGAFLVVMRPIIRLLLRYGIGYREFQEVIKTVYVDIGSSDYGIRGRPTNISRVAVMTGLTRKEVRRLRDKIAEGGSKIAVKTTPLSDVLHHWHAQDEFVDDSGNPKVLPFAGETSSFSSLVRKFGGDIPAGAMRTEMKRVGAVIEHDDGTLSVAERTFRPSEDHDTLITSMIHGVYPVLANVLHNTDPNRDSDTWANRIAYTRSLDPAECGRLRRIAKDRIVDFAESIDDIFMTYESIKAGDNNADSGKDKAPISVGVFYFEERDKDAEYEW